MMIGDNDDGNDDSDDDGNDDSDDDDDDDDDDDGYDGYDDGDKDDDDDGDYYCYYYGGYDDDFVMMMIMTLTESCLKLNQKFIHYIREKESLPSNMFRTRVSSVTGPRIAGNLLTWALDENVAPSHHQCSAPDTS